LRWAGDRRERALALAGDPVGPVNLPKAGVGDRPSEAAEEERALPGVTLKSGAREGAPKGGPATHLARESTPKVPPVPEIVRIFTDRIFEVVIGVREGGGDQGRMQVADSDALKDSADPRDIEDLLKEFG